LADPLIVMLLGLVQREGIWLACAVMVLDNRRQRRALAALARVMSEGVARGRQHYLWLS
jgi:hypothetical protein